MKVVKTMDKVWCPYCGAEMVLRDWHDVFFGKGNFFECVCGAKTPIKASPDAAHAAAMQRWQEPNRVLTLEEILALDPDGATCVESRRGEIEAQLNSELRNEVAAVIEDYGTDNARKMYGKYARAWLRRPTDEERAGAGWVDEVTV